MNRNSETIFSNLPSINIQRSVLDIPFNHRTTFNTGELIPFYIAECLPSDSVKVRTNKVIRLQTLLTPIMDSLVADVTWWFVPNRLTWTHWKEFMGENTQSAYLPEITYRPPQIICGSDTYGGISTGDILDYMGMPLQPGTEGSNWIKPIALPLRAYWLIWNEFWRDQNLQDPINVPLGDSDVYWKNVDAALKKPLPVNRLHDYFSSALKAPAKNADGFVTAVSSRQYYNTGNPFITAYGAAASHMAPIHTATVNMDFKTGDDYPGVHFHNNSDGTSKFYGALGYVRNSAGTDTQAAVTLNDSLPTNYGAVPDNLYADLRFNAFGITIPALRQAFQMQKFLEREASHGSRYQETLLSHFTVRSQDSRLQRPEYLGGNRIPLNVSQVVNQSQSTGEYLGDVGALSLTTDSHFDVEYSCQEHGYLIGLICVRYKNSYSQGFDRSWYKETRFDYAWPEFSHLTDQAIRNWELYSVGSDGDYLNGVFGYQERYAEYKFKPSINSGEMRPGISNSLASWHLGDYYTEEPYLSDEWLQVSKAPVDRALAVTSAVSNQIFADIYCQCRWTRPLPVHSNPGFADHF